MKRLLSLTILILAFGILGFEKQELVSAVTIAQGPAAGILQFSSDTYSFPENGGSSIFPPGATPTQSSLNNAELELGMKLRSDVSGFITGVRFYKLSTDMSVHGGSLWSSTGQLLATGAFTNETATGWQQLNFDSPVAITANTTYIASYHTSGPFFYNLSYFQGQGVDNPPLHALSAGVDGPNGVYRYGPAGVVPSASYSSSNYWVDVVFSTSPQVTITRTGGSTGAVGISLLTSNGTASAGSDYTAVNQIVSFANGETARTVSIPILDDSFVEGNETVNLALSNPTGGADLGSPSAAVLTIVDDESAPAGTLQFSTAAYIVAENGGNAAIIVTRTGGSAGAVAASFTTSDGTATLAGSDYSAVSQTVNFADGDTVSKTVNVPILDDGAVEGNETVNLALSSPTGGATLGSRGTAVLTIIDNESPAIGTLQFSSTAYSLDENGSSSIFAPGTAPTQSSPNAAQLELGVKLRSDVSGFITGIRFYKGPTDTSVHTGSLWSPAGQLLATGTFTNETATGWQQLNFDAPAAITANTTYTASYHTSSAFFYNVGYFQSQGVNNAPLHALQDGVDGPNGVYRYGGGGVVPSDNYSASNYWVDVAFAPSINAMVTVTRTGGSTGAVGASFATSNGTAVAGADYTAVSKTVNFADGDTASKTVVIPILDDTVVEGSETVSLALTNPTGGATLGSPNTAVLTIVDNEAAPAGTLQFSTAAYNISENGGNATITVTRTGGSTGAVSAHFATSDGSATVAGLDYTAVSGTVNFGDGDTVSQTVNVPILDDASAEGEETVNLALSNPTGGAILGSPSTAVLTIIDNESAPIGTLQFSAATYSLAENGTISIFAPGDGPTQSSPNSDPLELGMWFYSDVNGVITGIRFYKGPANTSIHTGSLWAQDGTLLATGTFTNETATGWQQLNFDAPAAITSNTRYRASYNTSSPFSYSGGFFDQHGVDNPPVHAFQDLSPPKGSGPTNGVFRYGAGVAPGGSYNSTNYWVDVTFAPGPNAMVTVTRTGGATGAVGATVATSNGTALAGADYTAVSRTVNFANGDTASKTVVIPILDDTLAEGSETVNVALTNPTGGATLGSPNTAVLTIVDNESTPAGTLQFTTAAYNISENGGSATITVTRTGGSAGAVTAHLETSDGTATLAGADYTAVSATVNFADGDTASKTFNVPILDDASVEGAETVNLTLSSPTGGATLGNPSAAVLTIIDNESAPLQSLQFSAASYSLAENGSSSIFAPGATPTQSSPNSQALELGVKFRSEVSGFITGIRFYKGPTDSGVHTGSLWSPAGALLGTGAFTNETATGWQQLTFDAPVAITAGTLYTASYHTTRAFFYDPGFFQSQGMDNVPLHAPRDGVGGPNGVFRYSAGGVVPSDSYSSTRYWVDVTFAPSLSAMVTVTRTGGGTGAVGATVATSNGTALAGSDYTAVSKTVNFGDGDTASKTVVIPILDDNLVEGSETVNLALTNPTGGATLGSPNTAVLTIVDNELTLYFIGDFGLTHHAIVDADFDTPLEVTVIDGNYHGFPGVTVTFSAPSTGPSATFGGSKIATATTDQSGTARLFARANSIAGKFQVAVSALDVPGSPMLYMETSLKPAFAVATPGGSPQSAVVGKHFVNQLQVRVTDAASNPVTGLKVTFTSPSSGPSTLFTNVIDFTQSDGLAVYSTDIANNIVGSYQVSASVPGLAPVTFDLTNDAVSTRFIFGASEVANGTGLYIPNPTEFGVKFRSDVSGFITGIRFFKMIFQTGEHTGSLWTSGGVLLATGTFSAETVVGWQQLNFTQPVPIEANMTYVASYHAQNASYSSPDFQFAGVDNGSLHALKFGVDGPNGVYAFGAGTTFPNLGNDPRNYWVDIVFEASGSQ